MPRSDKSLEDRRRTVESLRDDLSIVHRVSSIYLQTLNDRWNELEELSYATGHPLSSINHIRSLLTYSKETNPES